MKRSIRRKAVFRRALREKSKFSSCWGRLEGEDEIVALSEERPEGRREHQGVQGKLDQRGADLDIADADQVGDALDGQAGKGHVSAARVGDQIDGMAQIGQGFQTEIDADGRSPGLEERLWGEHQDLHRHGLTRPWSVGFR